MKGRAFTEAQLEKFTEHEQEDCPAPRWAHRGTAMFERVERNGSIVWLCTRCGADVIEIEAEVSRGEETGTTEANVL